MLLRFLLICLFFPMSVFAHPVSFEGSKGVMGHHSPWMNHVQLNYSFTHRFALGVHHFNVPSSQQSRFSNFMSANFLFKRWNGPSYQANLYGVLGLGHAKMSERSFGAGLGQLQFDIEDRKYYFLTSYKQIESLNSTELKQGLVRMGIAPYVAQYSDIHTWIILEWQNMEILEEGLQSDVTPFLRVFYKNILFEIGQSFNGVTRFNYIAHF